MLRAASSSEVSGGLQLGIALLEDQLVASLQPCSRGEVSDGAVKPGVVVVGHEVVDHLPGIRQAQRRQWADALRLQGLVVPLQLPVGLRVIR